MAPVALGQIGKLTEPTSLAGVALAVTATFVLSAFALQTQTTNLAVFPAVTSTTDRKDWISTQSCGVGGGVGELDGLVELGVGELGLGLELAAPLLDALEDGVMLGDAPDVPEDDADGVGEGVPVGVWLPVSVGATDGDDEPLGTAAMAEVKMAAFAGSEPQTELAAELKA